MLISPSVNRHMSTHAVRKAVHGLALTLAVIPLIAFACITENPNPAFDHPTGNIPKHCKPIDSDLFEQRFNQGLLPEHQFIIRKEIDLNWDGQCEALVQSSKGGLTLIRQIHQPPASAAYAMEPVNTQRLETIADLTGVWQSHYYRVTEQDWISFTTRQNDKSLLWQFTGKEYRITEEVTINTNMKTQD